VIECLVAVGHSPRVADMESRALPARPQPAAATASWRRSMPVTMVASVRPENRPRQAAEPAADVEHGLAFADAAKIQDRLRQSLAPATMKC
jgi:predicted nucleic acid-binding Zn ribbon protein